MAVAVFLYSTCTHGLISGNYSDLSFIKCEVVSCVVASYGIVVSSYSYKMIDKQQICNKYWHRYIMLMNEKAKYVVIVAFTSYCVYHSTFLLCYINIFPNSFMVMLHVTHVHIKSFMVWLGSSLHCVAQRFRGGLRSHNLCKYTEVSSFEVFQEVTINLCKNIFNWWDSFRLTGLNQPSLSGQANSCLLKVASQLNSNNFC